MSVLEQFLSMVIPEPNSGCWLWMGPDGGRGYGQFTHSFFNGKIKAHLASALFFALGRLDGKVVCHKCDTPSCVNPKHLFIGTQKDNMEDCARKGRIRIWDVPPVHCLPRQYCKYGHELHEGNRIPKGGSATGCKACEQIKTYLNNKTNRGTGLCMRGHELIHGNTLIDSTGVRCRICSVNKDRARNETVSAMRAKAPRQRLEAEAANG